ncbi:hypothetical protein [Chitinilyticum piscinae]|uniref:Uncharacterized protein n=1 Tax=Chitinilyticum piscinae TaxID=2866724 RepID=A0A8J7FYC9_9NEIS|nr:hypothetical protein [Chitinilyticum piscinae]MBE9607973.1 hypothetical protein [Chitinilyticum piscinae]
MAQPGVFLDVILPICIVTGLAGFLLYALVSRLLYDYVDEHYNDMLDKPKGSLYADPEELGAYMGSIWLLTRTGRFRRILSRPVRVLFWLNGLIGALMVGSTLIICLAFLPGPWH